MTNKSKSYDAGKEGEHDSWYLLENLGFVKPEREDRRNLVAAFLRTGIDLKTRGFDVLEKATLEDFRKSKDVSKIVLYEVKTAGKNRKQRVLDDFTNLGFTLTSSEKHNADVLKEQYKFIFLNLQSYSHMICSIDDFFTKERANIYETWSIFITRGISPQKNSTERQQR